jgi:hypothetical protein
VKAASPETYYSGAGDGYVSYGGSSTQTWATVHNATSGDLADYTGTYTIAESFEDSVGTNYYGIVRTFLPFDTSGLPDGATITAANLSIYVTATVNSDNDGYDYIGVVQTTQASNSSLVIGDYNDCGAVNSPTQGATAIDITGISTSAYTTFTLSATGIGWINLTGWTYLGIREGHDLAGHPIATNKDDSVTFSPSNYIGTSQDPYLLITYTSGGPTPEERSFSFVETVKPSATLSQWQEHSHSFTETLKIKVEKQNNFGNEATEIWSDAAISNYVKGTVFTMVEDGTANSIIATLLYIDDPYINGKIRCAIYKYSDLSLVAVTEERTLTLTATSTQYTFNFVTKPNLVATDYILVAWGEWVDYKYAFMNFDYGDPIESVKSCSLHKAYDGNFPDTITAPKGNEKYLIYCTYSTSGLSYWQEQKYVFTELTAPSSAFSHWMEGAYLFFEFTETVILTSTLTYTQELLTTNVAILFLGLAFFGCLALIIIGWRLKRRRI